MKKSVLDDDAYLFTRKEETTNREKMANMTTGQKLRFLKDYYLIGAIAIAAIAGFVGYMIYEMTRPKVDPMLSVGILNYTMEEEKRDYLTQQLQTHLIEQKEKRENGRAAAAAAEEMGAEGTGGSRTDAAKSDSSEKKEKTVTSDEVRIDDVLSTEGATLPKLQVFAMTGQLDLILCDREDMVSLAQKGFFMDLSEVFSEEELEQFGDYLIYTEGMPEDEEDGSGNAASAGGRETEENANAAEAGDTDDARESEGNALIAPYGVDLTGSGLVQETLGVFPDPVAAVASTAVNMENAGDVIAYLLDAADEQQ